MIRIGVLERDSRFTQERTSAQALDRLRHLAFSSGESMRTVARWVLEERPTGPALADPEKTELSDDG